MSVKLAKSGDRFISNGLKEGLISGMREDDDYKLISPLVTDYVPQPKTHKGINIVREVQHDMKKETEMGRNLTLNCPINRNKFPKQAK